ncbi:tyrosine--tRNA ligase [Rhizobium leguminosarum]|uniref:tyrosine--tRNA ligase n=1 Tax=Rhizobium leguminosarum TaxID=384 RepID=UPI002E13B18F|nr:tyrosine--tRNA ligase [Rhizobium leguminosarum]WSH77973.1 tyrosine--tRNA ligase [Rhizobium leguminosarum]
MSEETSHDRQFRSSFLQQMQERGLVRQCTDFEALDDALAAGSITAYVGFDATAESLHVGHLMSLVAMRRLAACGHRIIALVGGGTTMLGDPSFRNSTRPMLSEDDIAKNIAGIRRNIEAVLGDHADRLLVVDNKDWLGPVGFLEFMRDVGVHFTVARMLSMDSVQSRLDQQQSLTMMEFSYMMLQAADFVELSKRHDCVLQMGGSDQWGNIVNGIELGRRTGGKALFGLTTPLLTTAAGEKMGKTQGGAVWLDPARLSPFEFWQFWRNLGDADLKRFLLVFSDLPTEEIDAIDEADPTAMNEAKKTLADHATTLVHGTAAAAQARRSSEKLFGGVVDEVTHRVAAASVRSVADLLLAIGFASSKSDGRRLIAGGAVRIGDSAVLDGAATMTANEGAPILVSVGKKRRALVELV